jgi:hypothetical protein
MSDGSNYLDPNRPDAVRLSVPFSKQPGSRFQFGTRTPPDLAGFVPQIVSAGKTTPPGG